MIRKSKQVVKDEESIGEFTDTDVRDSSSRIRVGRSFSLINNKERKSSTEFRSAAASDSEGDNKRDVRRAKSLRPETTSINTAIRHADAIEAISEEELSVCRSEGSPPKKIRRNKITPAEQDQPMKKLKLVGMTNKSSST